MRFLEWLFGESDKDRNIRELTAEVATLSIIRSNCPRCCIKAVEGRGLNEYFEIGAILPWNRIIFKIAEVGFDWIIIKPHSTTAQFRKMAVASKKARGKKGK